MAEQPTVRMLGTRGVPGRYGGFETCVDHVSRYLVRHGWRVIVYCQVEGKGPVTKDLWEGVERVLIPVNQEGWAGTAWFDLKSVRHAWREGGLVAVFGYNTAIFNVWQRLTRSRLVFNMDGIEWARSRWGVAKRVFLYLNERIAALIGHRLIADHPEIARHVATRTRERKITMIPYGAPEIWDASTQPLEKWGLAPGRYSVVVCRTIPENHMLEIVQGFCARRRDHKLLLVAPYDPNEAYNKQLIAAANDDVIFADTIYDPEEIGALRYHSALYIHGHSVGGTNPSLVEALGAGSAVLAHDNRYNRWVAGVDTAFFRTAGDVAARLDELLDDPARLDAMRASSRQRFQEEFTWDAVAESYRKLFDEEWHRVR